MSQPTWNFVEVSGYFASLLVLSTFSMRTMIPLRCSAIASNLAFLTYSYLAHLTPVLVLHLVLLPLNVWRLLQITRLLQQVRSQTTSTFSIEPLLPLMTRQEFRASEVIFRQGDRADRLYYVLGGEISFPELFRQAGPGRLFGEIGVFSPGQARSASAIAACDSVVLSLSDRQVQELYFQNPAFGLALMRLVIEHYAQRSPASQADSSLGTVQPLSL
ncbi:MAG: cyclic nucleotide-binding domain-containing protein [Zoogloeaceae bacterium]|nr:cyclic nucleotide-binding domain-containing protein [Zoogloeaceae bacterium]